MGQKCAVRLLTLMIVVAADVNHYGYCPTYPMRRPLRPHRHRRWLALVAVRECPARCL